MTPRAVGESLGRHRALLRAFPLLGLLACGEPGTRPASQVIVIVDAEDGVRGRTDELKLLVKSKDDDGATVYNETLRRSDEDLEWPWVIAVTPKDGETDRRFEVVATAREEGGDFVAQVRAITGFLPKKKLTLTLLLEDACIEIECDSAETCHEGECADAAVDPNDLPPYDAADIPDPVVVGPRDPGAGGDGGPIGPSPGGDSGTPQDGGLDATVPIDGSASPGCTPNPNRENEVCPEKCPETCNNKDDDCDLKIDEGKADDDCDLPHATSTCERGVCTIMTCTGGYRDCDMEHPSGCESPPGDINNCGPCGYQCRFPNMIATCAVDTCLPIGCIDLYEDCDMSGDSCEVPTNTLVDCGRCGIPCGNLDNAEPTCIEGFCGPGSCTGNFGDCNRVPGDGCEEPLDSMTHCAGCDTPCDFTGSTDDCSSGTCVAVSCEAGFDDCDLDTSNGCESLSSDAHCGACNQACDDTLDNVLAAGCTATGCEVTCDIAGGYDDCDDDPLDGCESTRTLTDCGECDQVCAFGNAVASCDTGVCTRVRCDDGFDDCNLDGLACEQSLLDDPAHCGACNDPCPAGMPNCSGGLCTAASCSPGTADCSGSGACDTNTNTSLLHCGSCNHACTFTPGVTPNATATCVGGMCVPLCTGLFKDCDGIFENGCERSIATVLDCGDCNVPCSIMHATETCATGACRVNACESDWDDCNSDDTSCETPLNTVADCNACGAACNLTNALATCAGSPGSRTCEIAGCTQSYYADCDDQHATGCEIDTRSVTAHCGACDNDCTQKPQVNTAHCTSSACVIDTCDPGFDNCTGSPGCETALGASPNCGSCGDDCALLANTSSTTCSSYNCRVVSCDAGYDNCDGSHATGCETDIFDPLNCGGCAPGQNEPCANLPHVALSSCDAGDCKIETCATDWLDCNGVVADGCEQQQSVIGPCFPDTNCTLVRRDGVKKYFFCRNDRAWGVARPMCQNQLLGDLVRIDDAAENTFVTANITGSSWIGATDAPSEGVWFWIDSGVQFWSGAPAPGGGPVWGRYSNWSAGQPANSNGNEDCGSIQTTGAWSANTCPAAQDFVCEVQDDLCPNDPNKSHPGQCGCGVPDVHSDGDGTADCIDGCDFDPNKVAPGQCGCGNPDTDSDGDGVANCHDGCDDDPNKTTPGACGCGVADTDTDNDGNPDCVDVCPFVIGGGPICDYPYGPSNFDPRRVNFDRAFDAIIDCANPIIDTTDAVTISDWCGQLPTPEIHTMSDNQEAVVIPLLSLQVAAGRSIRLIGVRPVIFAVAGEVLIEGGINARAIGTIEGAGGETACMNGTGNDGGQVPAILAGGGGGGGGGFGTMGGNGGTGFRTLVAPIPGGPGGTAEGFETLAPLRGGCSGGHGGGDASVGDTLGGRPGAAGGAFQISAAGRLTVVPGAVLTASGGGGLGGQTVSEGGGGGGSGGAVLLEGTVVQMDVGSWVTANGGGGGAGKNGSGNGGAPGTDGDVASVLRAPGGSGAGGAGGGGLGGAYNGNPSSGGNGSSNAGGGGGGGGAVGRIRINGQLGCTAKSSFSPTPTTGCP